MPSRRRPAPFRPLSSLPKPETAATQRERQLRELEAEETAQDALRFARDIRRRQALEEAASGAADPHHPDPAVPDLVDPADPWEDIPQHLLDENEHQPGLHGQANAPPDPILLSLEEQAKHLKRKKLTDNWDAIYATIFDAYLKAKHISADWSTPEWSQDSQPACNCGPGLVRERDVVLVDFHCMFLELFSQDTCNVF